MCEDVVRWLERAFPLSFAEDWDNVGLLVEPTTPAGPVKVFLTNDLTEPVVDEAVALGATLVVTYHPLPFHGIKRLTQSDPKQRILLKCVEAGMAVYSPHTACDNAKNGVNDWLAQAVICEGISATTVRPIVPCGEEGAGKGRVVEFNSPQPLATLIASVKRHLRVPTLRFAPAEKAMNLDKTCMEVAQEILISRVAVQAGSGAGVLAGVRADLFLTGEMGHHDVLAATAAGTSVLLAEHSNSERAFLFHLQERLQKEFPCHAFIVSQRDCDPLRVV